MKVATYILSVEAQEKPSFQKLQEIQSRTLFGLLQETEENLTDLLPEGWSVVINEWDEEDE